MQARPRDVGEEVSDDKEVKDCQCMMSMKKRREMNME